MKEPLFTGACTALVTPFLDGKVNYPMMDQLLGRQMEAGIGAVVVCGTTGESPTLTDEEKIELVRRCKVFAGNDCLIIAGTGTNATAHAVDLSKKAEEASADALLVVSPYYNKATPDGLVAHYLTIAHAVSIPVIVYNVPSRTGVDIPVSVYKRLSAVPNIIGVKEASSDITKIAKIKGQCGRDFSVWSGNDDQAVAAISVGASGLISVLSNLYPEETNAMCYAALKGNRMVAAKLQQHFLPLIELLFSEVNPIPVKAAMQCMGYDCGGCRLPLCEPTKENLIKIQQYFA